MARKDESSPLQDFDVFLDKMGARTDGAHNGLIDALRFLANGGKEPPPRVAPDPPQPDPDAQQGDQ